MLSSILKRISPNTCATEDFDPETIISLTIACLIDSRLSKKEFRGGVKQKMSLINKLINL